MGLDQRPRWNISAASAPLAGLACFRWLDAPLCLSSLAMNSISEGVSWRFQRTFLVSLEVFEAKILFLGLW
ncbi:hypothetical protein NC651_012344 [Populus alba x Populus x berolinensis]|nr:hypothetical protein NC651_012344 [Populus alba x Populus x berolinensis]